MAIPMDSVIAACAEARGVEIVYGDFQMARNALRNERFDCILLSNVLHLVEDPVTLLSSFASMLRPNGIVLLTVPNFAQITTRWRRLKGAEPYRHLGDFEKTGIHVTTRKVVEDWLIRSGLVATRFDFIIPKKGLVLNRLSLGVAASLLGEEIVCRGKILRRSAPATQVGVGASLVQRSP